MLSKCRRSFIRGTVALGALVVLGAPGAWAHVDPPGSSGTGITGEMTAFRNDGVTPVLPGTVSPCETIIYRATVRAAGGINGAFEGGVINIVTPDGVTNNVTPVGGVPCVGGTFDDPNSAANGNRGLCAGAPTFINSQTIAYVVDPTDAVMNTITANLNYNSAFAHISATDQFGVGAATPLPITIEPCPASTDCVTSFCDPALVAGPRLGVCTTTNVVDSTPCDEVPDVPGDCNTPGCEAGVCVATHIPEPNSTVCSTTPDIPGDCGTPGCEGGVCVATHINVPNSTVCSTTPDITGDCGSPGCESGVCVATHINVPDSTVCTTTPDVPGDCRTPGCEAGSCVATHINEPNSTVCTSTPDITGDCGTPGCEAGTCVATHINVPDSTACTSTPDVPGDCRTPGCESGVCVATHINQPNSTVCTTTPDITGDCGTPGCEAGTCVATHIAEPDSTPCTDTDLTECTTAGCEMGMCVQTHIENCQEICRTPGFWKEHAFENPDKNCSQNITQAVINEAGGSLSVCGKSITNTNPGNGSSALEALCVKIRGEQRLQLGRQLTAAALNCVVSGGSGACDGVSIEALFDDCNLACQSLPATHTIGECISAIDCFNNGGSFNEMTGVCSPGGTNNCHDQALPLEDLDLPNNDPGAGACFGKQGAAGSQDQCKAAQNSPCTIFSCP